MNRRYLIQLTFLFAALVFAGCGDEEYALPEAKNALQNDCIKRSIGPNIVGQQIEFAYAMAIPKTLGKLVSAEVVASIAGDVVAGPTGTFLEHRAFTTSGAGADVPVTVGDPSTTEGTRTVVNFTVDTTAVTLRYFYRIPEAARGQRVSFTFSATASNGQTVSMTMGPYAISKMDMVLDRNLSNNNVMYISIADMQVYNAADAAANADKIDLVYLHRTVNVTNAGVTSNVFGHALVAPAAEAKYLPGVTLPAGVNKNTKVLKMLNLRDRQLARLQFGIFVDDLDFETINMAGSTNYMVNVRQEFGAWVETADGQYRAYVYINAVTATASSQTMRISMKRYRMN